MRRIVNLALKDLLLLWRDKFGLFWVVGFPLGFAIFFGSIFSSGDEGPRAIRIAVYDGDSTSSSADFVAELEKSEALDVVRLGADEAREQIRRGKLTGYVLIEEGFSNFNPFFSGGSLPVKIGVDPSRRAEAGYLQGILTKLMFASFQKRMWDSQMMIRNTDKALAGIENSTGLSDEQRSTLTEFFTSLGDFFKNADSTILNGAQMGMGEIEVESVERSTSRKSPRSAYDVSFPQAIIWGLIGCAAAFAISIVQERTTGTFLRLRLAPISRVHILAGKGTACFIACIVVMVLLLSIGRVVFGVNTSNLTQLSMAILASALCFVGIMMLISVLGRTERSVGGAGWAILMVMAMAGGGMVPVMFMPGWMRAIGQASPVKWAIYSLEGAIWRQFSTAEMLLPVGVLLGIGLLFFTVGAAVFSRTEL